MLPLLLAVPFYEAVQTTSFLNSYFEMVSAFTTTGAPLFEPGRLSGTMHLWRAQVGWLGGLFVWITAAAVLVLRRDFDAADKAIGALGEAEATE